MPGVLTIVLAGGEGKRLAPLTLDRAKPAVPFGGNYRLIDFALSNLVNAGFLRIVVLTQYKSHSLDRHLATTWRLSPDQVSSDELAGEPIRDVLTAAPGNGAPIGGLKVVAEHGWFAARPSGTEDVYKVYAESLDGEQRLERILREAREIVGKALA